MKVETYHGVLLSQDAMRCICRFQDGIDGVAMDLYAATKHLLRQVNHPLGLYTRRETFEKHQKERLDATIEVYDDFFKPWSTSNKAMQSLPAAHLFKPMLEYIAMVTCDTALLHRLHDQRQLRDLTGEMLAFVLFKWPWSDPTKRARLGEILTIRQDLSTKPFAWQTAMLDLAYLGSLEGVQYVYETSPSKYGSHPIDIAAANGHLDIVQFFLTNTRDCDSTNAMDQAATNGHMEVVQYLHEKSAVGATNQAMDGAAANGHLEIVRFLHEHCQEGCSTDAADLAATNGHLEVVKFLIDHRKEGYTTKAMDGAASHGHLDMVRFLHD
ncbi:unnamed protein product [Aphanomyces euteiches]|uniref:Uncharacterized protein n=1 Tax=Aphanomyces euteiches TaxID=100861 RepID=A0A6G0WY05_9STRA|nr:hypothetical protein Ae201684_010451 [Aphanomyces euteiches]KAH9090018.1 hypothetical protein Ae201684P_014773 [Aphanomyces euteiches]KAH9138594.1 hypothetical protein AeRB84_017105 [Aphanomyces euteiches]